MNISSAVRKPDAAAPTSLKEGCAAPLLETPYAQRLADYPY